MPKEKYLVVKKYKSIKMPNKRWSGQTFVRKTYSYDVTGLDIDELNSCLSVRLSSKNKFKPGDIISKSHGCYKVEYNHRVCKPAIVTGTDIIDSRKEVCAFSVQYGDVRISLNKDSPFFYTKRGDNLLIYKVKDKKEYEIITNETVDKMRADFVQKQK